VCKGDARSFKTAFAAGRGIFAAEIMAATGLGVEACRQGISTRFVTGCGLANELLEARQGLTLSRIIKRYARYGLLILDELGYVPFSKEGAELLFQVLAERHERGSVIITSNLGFADWTQVFGEPTLTAALLDRLTHKPTLSPAIGKASDSRRA
jgi:DNA replication protein DnaC